MKKNLKKYGLSGDDRLEMGPDAVRKVLEISGEVGFILTAAGVVLFFGMMLGALAAVNLIPQVGCGG